MAVVSESYCLKSLPICLIPISEGALSGVNGTEWLAPTSSNWGDATLTKTVNSTQPITMGTHEFVSCAPSARVWPRDRDTRRARRSCRLTMQCVWARWRSMVRSSRTTPLTVMRQPMLSASPWATTVATTAVSVVTIVSIPGIVAASTRCGWACSSR